MMARRCRLRRRDAVEACLHCGAGAVISDAHRPVSASLRPVAWTRIAWTALTSSSDAACQTSIRDLYTSALAELHTTIAVGVATGWLPPDEFEALVPILMDFSVA